MEVNIFEFFQELQRFFKLNELEQTTEFSKPVQKINFDYDYFSYLCGKIYVTKYFDYFVDNNKITITMLSNITNINRTERMILTDKQRDLFNWLKKGSIEKLESEMKFLNKIISEAKQLEDKNIH